MDKASILGDAIEYVKQLQTRVTDMELRMKQLELKPSHGPQENGHGSLTLPDLTMTTSPSEQTFNSSRTTDIKGSQLAELGFIDFCDLDGVSAPVVPSCDNEIRSQAEGKCSSSFSRKEADNCNSDNDEADACQVKRLRLSSDVKVKLIETDASIELHCPCRVDLLIDVLQTLQNLQLDVNVVHATTMDGNLTTSFKAKVL